jgi:hypothetical protein
VKAATDEMTAGWLRAEYEVYGSVAAEGRATLPLVVPAPEERVSRVIALLAVVAGTLLIGGPRLQPGLDGASRVIQQ